MNEKSDSVASTDGMPELSPLEAVERDFSLLAGLASSEAGDSAQRSAAEIKEAEDVEFLGFRVADLNLLCSFDRVAEVTSVPNVFRVPNLPPWITGAASLRGEITPIIDLTCYLGLTATPELPMLVVVGRGDERAGLLVDDRPDIYRFSTEHLLSNEPPMHEELKNHLLGAYQKDGLIWLEIDLSQLIDKMTGKAG